MAKRAGFTLIELMIVVVILGVTFGIVMQATTSATGVPREMSRRFAVNVEGLLDSQKLSAMTGRGIMTSATGGFNPAATRVWLGTGTLAAQYLSGTLSERNGRLSWNGTPSGVATGTAFQKPFLGNSAFTVKARGVTLVDGQNVALSPSDGLWIDFVGGNAYLSGSNWGVLSGAVAVQLVLDYAGTPSTVEFDRRSGRVSSWTDRYPGCFGADVKVGSQYWAACDLQHGGKGCGPMGCGGDGAENNYFQWGYSNGSFSGSRTGGAQWSSNNRGPCALGYHVPSFAEFNSMVGSVGITNIYTSALAMGKNGQRNPSTGVVFGTGTYGWWWTSTETSVNGPQANLLNPGGGGINGDTKDHGLSVRCIRD